MADAMLKNQREREDFVMLKSQKNKKKFIEPFEGMINENGKNSLVYIPKDCIVELEKHKKVSHVQAPYNNWFTANYDCSEKIELIEMIPDYYKIVSGGQIGEFLRHYKWRYDGKNVYCCNIATGRKIRIERVILNYNAYRFFKPVDLDKAAHHMWFRACALVGTLKSLDKELHLNNHSIIGNYDRGQSIVIKNIADFDYFISVVDAISNLLKNRTFSIEF